MTCVTQYDGLPARRIFGPTTYSEPFFPDEATAFAAGHRPCGFCRGPRPKEFKAAWLAADGELLGAELPSAGGIDQVLRCERVERHAGGR